MPTRSGLDFAARDLNKEGGMTEGVEGSEHAPGTGTNAHGADGKGEKGLGGATGSGERRDEQPLAEKEEAKEELGKTPHGEAVVAARAGRESDKLYRRSASWQGFEDDAASTRWRYTMLPKVEVPERFSGEVRRGPSLKNYLMQLENLRARWERDRLDADEFFRGLANTLTGEAETYYRICRRGLLDWAAQARPGERDPTKRFLEMLREQFPLQTPERVVEFCEFKRRSGESFLAYYGRLVELAKDMNCVDQGRLVSKFLNRLNYELQRDVQVKIFEMGATATLGVAYETTKRVEIGRRLFEVELTAERATERRRPARSAAPVDRERPPRGPGDSHKCHNCGQTGHLRRDCRNPLACSICGQEEHQRHDCPEAPVCGKCGRRGHVERECYSRRGEGRGDSRERSEVAEMRAEIERLRAQLEGRELGGEKKPAMVARKEEEESSEEDFCLMAWHVRERDELGLRAWERNLRPRTELRREAGPRRRAGAGEEDPHPPRRHPLERLSYAASVLVAEKGYIIVGGVSVKQAIIDTGAHPMLIEKRLAQQLQLDRPERQVEAGLLLMTAEGGGTKWMPKTRSTVEIYIRQGGPEECSVKLQCGILPSEDYDLLLGVEFLYSIGATICMWEEKLTYRVEYWEKNRPVAELPVRFIRREPREAYQAEIRTVEEELGILSWERLEEERRHRDWHRQHWGESGRLRELHGGVFQKPIVLLELFGGISTGLAAVLKAGLRVAKYIYVENDEVVDCMAWHHIKKLEERYPSQLYADAVEKGAEWVCHRVEDVKEDALAHWGHVDLVIAGWECQGLSRAGEGRGMQDPRSGLFRELVRILKLIKRKQGEVAYIVENVDTRDDTRRAVKEAEAEIRAEMGAGVAWDAAQNGSRAHRPCRYWQNVVPEAALQYKLSMMERPRARLVQGILEPAITPAPVRHPDHETQFPCNAVGKPRQARPTLVAHDQARGFKMEGGREGPGMVFDSLKGIWEEPTAMERELAMGFMTGATTSGDVREQQRKRALGNAMDLNALHWLVGVMHRHLEKRRLERRRDHAENADPKTEEDERKQQEAELFLDLLEQEAWEERQKGVPVERRMERLFDRDGVPGRYPDQEEEEGDVEEWGEPEMDWDSEDREDPTDRWIPDPDEVFLGPGRAYMALRSEGKEEQTGEAGEGVGGEVAEAAGREVQPAPQAGTAGEGQVAGGAMERDHHWNIGSALQGTATTRLEAVLRQHAAVFAHSLQELGKCTVSTMHLPLTSEVPVYQRRRRMSPQDIEVCTAKCQELLAAGLIRRSASDYAAATVVAARTDLTGAVLSRRMCGDFRGLNKVTATDCYPMPMAEEIFDQLHGSWVFSTLDLRQGFNQIPIAEEDKRKTTFHGPDGLYEWNFMPFGLRNASAVFQRVIDTVLREVKGAACYIDDVIIFSLDSERHVEDIEAILAAIQAAGLTCHPGKCRFGHISVAYLGFEVAGGESSIQKAKVEVLDRVGRPKDRSGLRALLGFLNYYRKFIPDFSKRAAPLNKLLREDQKWQSEEAQKAALKGLMEAVKAGAVLKLPDGKAPFVLYTDWSSVGMGAVLSQMEGGQEKVVAFASRTCNPAEANYSSYEGEGLATVWAVGHFRVYLQGRHFTLVTDHQPLLWLMQNQTLTGRNARWAMKLQEYDFTVKHRPGKTMQHVDGLSRNPPREQEDGDTDRVQPAAALTAMVKEKGAVGEQERGAADVWQDEATLAWIKGETTEDGGAGSRARAQGPAL